MEEDKSLGSEQAAENIPIGEDLSEAGRIIAGVETAMPEAKESEAPATSSEEAVILEIKSTGQTGTKDNMEVHHHSHAHGKKNWKTYFWEFLMLFLAVFSGFLAENQREHYIEHQREKQYMVTMLDDLKSDTIQLSYAMRYWAGINNSIDSVVEALNLPLSLTDFPKTYRYLNNALNYYSFTYNDRTIAQLKNAGGFRLIRKKNVANKIIAYDQFNNDAIRNIADQYNQFYENVVVLRNKVFAQPIISKIFNQYEYSAPPISAKTWIDSLILKNKSPFSNEIQTELLFEFKNALLAFRKDFTNMEWGHTNLLKLQEDLIKLIEEEYHLE